MLCKTLSELYSKLGNGKWYNKGFRYFVTGDEFKYGKCYGDEKKLLLFPDSNVLSKDRDIVTPLGCHWMTLKTDNWEKLPDSVEGQIDKIDDQIKDIDDFIAYLKKGGKLDDTMSHPMSTTSGTTYYDGFTEEELKTVCYDRPYTNVGLSCRAQRRSYDWAQIGLEMYGDIIRESHCKDFVKTVHFVKSKPAGAEKAVHWRRADHFLFYKIDDRNNMFIYVPDGPGGVEGPYKFDGYALAEALRDSMSYERKKKEREESEKKRTRLE